MNIRLISFTGAGKKLADTCAALLCADGETACAESFSELGCPLKSWVQARFSDSDALIFISAAGIAVRSCAPFLKSKTSDPAVLCCDEKGQFVIPILSGHIGGGNRLAVRLARLIGAHPVLTTATDTEQVFAVDDWAVSHGMTVRNPEKIKSVSSALLAGGTVSVSSVLALQEPFPRGVVPARDGAVPDVAVTFSGNVSGQPLVLHPRRLTLGVGCRKGCPAETLEQQFQQFLTHTGLTECCFMQAASVDLKKEEPGLLAFCQSHGWELKTFSAPELMAVPGEFSHSDFVLQTTGADNVCERAAVLAGGKLIAGKLAGNGTTFAAAAELSPLSFDKTDSPPLWDSVSAGIPDALFERGNVPMTKSEVRAVSLSRLRLNRDSIVWDVGSGTGSVSVEMALQARLGQVWALEKNPDAAALTRKNAERFGVSNLTVRQGSAPDALRDFPAPDAVFVGGGGAAVPEVLRIALEKNPAVRIVLNAVTLETLGGTAAALKALPVGEVDFTQIAVTRTRTAGSYHLMDAQNPVWVISACGNGGKGTKP